MCLDDLKGEESNGDALGIMVEGLVGFFFGFLVSERSQDSTTDSRLQEFFISGRSANFSNLFNSPACI